MNYDTFLAEKQRIADLPVADQKEFYAYEYNNIALTYIFERKYETALIQKNHEK